MEGKSQVVGTGLSGLVGSYVVESLSDLSFSNLDLSVGVDITDEAQVREAVSSNQAETILHLAAFTDLNKAWEDRGNKDGVCLKVNVEGTRNIAKATAQTNKHLVYISTAYVFDGKKEGEYSELDTPSPIEWYGQTKLEGEHIVTDLLPENSTIIRIDQPFRPDEFAQKPDHVRKIIQALQAGNTLKLFSDSFFSPTYLADLVKAIKWCISKKPTGIFHVTTGTKLSPYAFGKQIQDKFNLGGVIEKSSLEEYLKDSTKRPYHKNTTLSPKTYTTESGNAVTSFEVALDLVQV